MLNHYKLLQEAARDTSMRLMGSFDNNTVISAFHAGVAFGMLSAVADVPTMEKVLAAVRRDRAMDQG